MNKSDLIEFLRESLMIEGIHRKPTHKEIEATENFLALAQVTLDDMVHLVSVYAPHAVLRNTAGLNVSVGDHIAPPGGMNIVYALEELLEDIEKGKLTPHEAHIRFELLHPFTDGNGRSGRALWLWHRIRDGQVPQLSFLHHFYYDTLSAARQS